MTDPRAKPGVEPGTLGTGGSSLGKWLGIGCGIPAALIIIIVLLATLWPKDDDEPYDPNWSGEAIAQCEELVKENLKAPSTAKFDTNANGYGTWTVTGTVDSENSFGAMLQAEFQCTVTIEGDSIRRRLDFLN